LRPADHHPTAPVPEHETVGGVQIALVIIGVAICLPAFITAAEIASALGPRRGLIAVFGGGLVLSVMACLTGLIGQRLRLSSYMIVLHTFGTRAGRFINLLLSLSVLGWYGVLTGMFARAVLALLGGAAAGPAPVSDAGLVIWSLAGSGLMVATTIFGFRALDKLSRLATPLMAALLVYVALLVTRDHAALLAFSGDDSLSVGRGLSITVGGLSVGAALMPDLARFARRRADVLIAAVLAYGVGYPLVMALAGLPAMATGQKDLLLMITGVGLGAIAMTILILSTWTTNAFNLYSCTLVLGTMFRSQQSWRLTLTAGVIGTILCLGGIGDAVVPYLVLIGAVIPPIAAVYIADFWIIRRATGAPGAAAGPGVRWAAVLSWAAGPTIAYWADWQQLSVTHIIPLDAAIAAFLVYLVAGTLRRRRTQGGRAALPGTTSDR